MPFEQESDMSVMDAPAVAIEPAARSDIDAPQLPVTLPPTRRALREVLVISGSPDQLNANAGLRDYVVEGLHAAQPAAQVLGVPYELGAQAISQRKPDLVVVFGSVILDTSDFAPLADLCRRQRARLVFWLHDDPYEFDMNERVVPYADAIFSNDLASVDHYPPTVPVFHLPLGASRLAHWRAIGPRSAPDLFFCGHAFENRLAFFEALATSVPAPRPQIQVFGTGWDTRRVPMAMNMKLANAALPDYYAAALAVANLGRDLNLANRRFSIRPSTPGPRTFEAAAAGAAQILLTDGLEITEYFTPDEEILVAQSADEFVTHWQRLLADRALSERLGRRAQQRALAEHGYEQRARTLLDALDSL